jgi:hypothetical protein
MMAERPSFGSSTISKVGVPSAASRSTGETSRQFGAAMGVTSRLRRIAMENVGSSDNCRGRACRTTNEGEKGVEQRPESWHPAGKTLSFLRATTGPGGSGIGDIWTLGIDGDRTAKPLLDRTQSNRRYSVFSPDGRWLAYVSGGAVTSPTGFNVFVQPFPPMGAQ